LGLDISSPTNLPHHLTPLLGRDAERDDVVHLLQRDEVRMVTLTGPGGTGKTRLSLAVGAELLREYDDGVWWISLGPVLDSRLVLSDIAATLDVRAGGVSLRVGNRFKLLSGGASDLPERQQTMRAAISWGYNLLDEEEKHLFATFSIFRGGFSLEAAERLAGDDALDGISSLLDKAFLRRDPA